VKPTHADFRPGKRPRFVPSGKPRRKIPLIRIALLISFGLLVYTRFDDYWPRLRQVATSASPFAATASQASTAASARFGALEPVWARDSSRATLACAAGLEPDCCDALESLNAGLCGEAEALFAKARWKQRLSAARAPAGKSALLFEARAIVSDLGDWGLELSGVRGHDLSGVYVFRRTAGTALWCDTRRGCLRDPLPRAPLAQGRLQEDRADAGLGSAKSHWVSFARQVLAVLPGRVVSVDSVSGGARVRVYHGREIYAEYGPLRPAAGVRAGVSVKAGSHLGDALAGLEGSALTVRVRQAGQWRDPAEFWGIEEVFIPESEPVVGALYSGTP
jgi:murein DD-endopeptidase MepM/ murein hydrolase activator NlpD